jgi:hypothetical protein
LSAKRTVLIISIIEVIAIIVIIFTDIFKLLLHWFPMTIMCLDLENLTKNLGMPLEEAKKLLSIITNVRYHLVRARYIIAIIDTIYHYFS